MQSYQIKYKDEKVTILPINTAKKYKIKALEEIKTELANTKSQLDKKFKYNIFGKYWKEFDPMKNERYIVSELGNTYNVSNAWLKCYEILMHFKLLPDELDETQEKFVHFDNAAFPGSFILATHHLVKTQKQWHAKYQWYASSLLDSNELDKEPLDDKYKLYKNYPNNWIMSTINNGDVLIPSNQLDFHKLLGNKVDLYTSDLGFDVSTDYNNQELLQASTNIAQILSGLITLKQGGCFYTKQYMTFEPITLSIMYAAASFFDEFYLCKPFSSREANSETYLVGRGFNSNSSADILQHPYIKAMFEKIQQKNDISIPIFNANELPTNYLKTIIKASSSIFRKQINKINEDIKRTDACISNRYRGVFSQNPIVVEFIDQIEPQIQQWYKNNKILPMVNSKRLDMVKQL